jgi:Holliday junction resolvase-like predicted endonuclease
MTVADEILRELGAHPEGMSDADLASTLGKRHQHINQTCRNLASQGLIVRENSYRGIVNKRSSDWPVPPAREPRAAAPTTSQDWAWEGNVQSRVATHLAANGWSIIRVADTASRERGVDIIAERDGQRLLVEVKGWPSSTYARGDRAGQPKPTQPTLQAAHWFAEALTSLIRLGAEPESRLAMGLPDMPRYRVLLGDAAWALDRLDITVYLATADGAVEIWEREN